LLRIIQKLFVHLIHQTIKSGAAAVKKERRNTMKTIDIKKTDNGNYVVCVQGIRGQQGAENNVHVFNSSFQFITTENANPYHSWVSSCNLVCRIGGVRNWNDTEALSEMLKKCVENNVFGYTTSGSLYKNQFQSLLPPLVRPQ